MQSVTFLGAVEGGRILTGQPLAAFEGKQVYVTLIAPEETRPMPTSQGDSRDPQAETADADGPDILEDAGRICLPPREVTPISYNMVEVGRRPMPIYPSDLED